MNKIIQVYAEGWTCSNCAEGNRGYEYGKCSKCDHKWNMKDDDTWEDNAIEVEFPCKWEICYDCRGDGKTYLGWASKDQPAFTASDFNREGPDFREDYMTGRYDATCPGCSGSGKIQTIDEPACNSSEKLQFFLKAHYEYMEQEAYHDAERESERRMGA